MSERDGKDGPTWEDQLMGGSMVDKKFMAVLFLLTVLYCTWMFVELWAVPSNHQPFKSTKYFVPSYDDRVRKPVMVDIGPGTMERVR